MICMSEPDIIKITSKGQVTIPSKYRKKLSLDRDSHLQIAVSGDVLVLKKVEKMSLEEISGILSAIAESEGITREDLLLAAKKARKEYLKTKNVSS